MSKRIGLKTTLHTILSNEQREFTLKELKTYTVDYSSKNITIGVIKRTCKHLVHSGKVITKVEKGTKKGEMLRLYSLKN